MAELTYDVSIIGLNLTVKCRGRDLHVKASPREAQTEYLDIALEAIKAENREIVQVIVVRVSMANRIYQVRTRPRPAQDPIGPEVSGGDDDGA
jgi:hypothetical protein